VACRTSQEKPGLYTSTCLSCGGQTGGGEELEALLSPWEPLVNLLSQGGRPHTTKIGHGYTGVNQKSEPCTGYKINLHSGATGRKVFTSIEGTLFKL
jgi:hypothetical protein